MASSKEQPATQKPEGVKQLTAQVHNGAIRTSQRSGAHWNGDSNGAVERLVDVRKLWAIVVKNWMVMKGDRVRLVPLILMPILMIVIFGYAAGGIPKQIPAALVDYDHSDFSQGVVAQLSAMDIFSIKQFVGTQEEGKALMDKGQIRVLFIIPQGIGGMVASGQPATINVMVDESDSSVASIAKSTAQAFAQRLSGQVTGQRLAAISAMAASGRADLARAGALSAPSSSASIAAASSGSAVRSYWENANYVNARASAQISATVQGMKNSLGYMVDQNELVSSYSPSSVAAATLALLATGDQQQSVLQQIGSYQGLQAAQMAMMRDMAGIYSGYADLAGQAAAQQKAGQVSAQFLSSAGGKLSAISQGAEQATNAISIGFVEPYGYGRKGIDFLLPAILAMTIFQGASMGLGRAIAGERKDGSLTRVFLTPTSSTTIILGTQVFYLLLEVVRSSLLVFVAILLFGVSITGNILDIIFIIAIFAMGCTGIGMVLSVITKTQDQYMALAMMISLPSMFLSGVFFPIQTMPPILQGMAQFLPITYAADALRGIMVKGFPIYLIFNDILVLVGFFVVTFALTMMFFKRELA
ncbi:MAG: ABC transporter permease [Candidatus Micrarchaeota archaeon]|nr:ABC transporter permease [Candidatus Micrarchaeota archaeon]